jgi:hypothetical protein
MIEIEATMFWISMGVMLTAGIIVGATVALILVLPDSGI